MKSGELTNILMVKRFDKSEDMSRQNFLLLGLLLVASVGGEAKVVRSLAINVLGVVSSIFFSMNEIHKSYLSLPQITNQTKANVFSVFSFDASQIVVHDL